MSPWLRVGTFIFLCLHSTSKAKEMSYSFDVSTDELQIELVVAGSTEGTTTFQLTPEWGGVEAPSEDLTSLLILDAAGAILSVDRNGEHSWAVEHVPGDMLTVRYAFPTNDHQSQEADRSDRYLPLVNEGLVHFIGELALLYPAHLDDERPVEVTLEWVGLPGRNWRPACSFGLEDRIEFSGTLGDVRTAVYMAGDVAVERRQVHGRPVGIAVAGDWDCSSGELADLVQRIVKIEREFFDDLDRPFYLASLIPAGKRRERGFSLSGTGLTNSFATFVMPGSDLCQEDGFEIELVKLLVHEMFHEWNGQVIGLEQPEEDAYWFSEGFTNFFTRRFLAAGGWEQPDDFVDRLNQTIREHFTSSQSRATLAELGKRFWTDREAQFQPYLRGELIACLVDHSIRQRTGGRQSLDDFMRSLVHEALASPSRHLALANRSLFERIEQWAGQALRDQVEAIVIEGAAVQMPRDLYAPALESFETEVVAFDTGLDLETTQATKVVTGVRPESSAWEAGLRDGQTLRSLSVYYGQTEVPVEIEVDDDGELRSISYLPQGPSVAVIQYRRVAEVSLEGVYGL